MDGSRVLGRGIGALVLVCAAFAPDAVAGAPPATAAPREEQEEFMICRNVTKGSVVASKVVVAATRAARREGLLGRSSITPDEGLLILPCSSVHTIGMKFAIDVVFLDDDKRVVEIRPSVAPGVPLMASLHAESTLELAAGASALRRLQVGDRLVFAPATEEKEKDKDREKEKDRGKKPAK
jgi:uncharacterized membrane protein (UPF0127 family)